MRFAPDVQAYVIPIRFEPVDRVGADEYDAPVFLKHQPIRLPEAGPQIVQQRGQPPVQLWVLSAAQSFARMIQGLLEPVAVERFEKVINRVDLERLQRILVVSGRSE